VLTAEALGTAVRQNPLSDQFDDPSRLHVAFLAEPADRDRLKGLSTQDWSPERFALGTRVAYLWCPGGIIAGELAEAVGRLLGDAVTTRNWATVTKLHSLCTAKPS
jgi:uncharacterized protein (DUF1697 family)